MTFVNEAIERNKLRIGQALGTVPSGSDLVLATPTFSTSMNIVYLVFDGDSESPVLVIKRARDFGVPEGLRHEAALLRRVSGFRVRGMITTPLLIAEEASSAGPWIMESAVRGTMLTRRVVRRNVQRCLDAASAWCRGLHAYTISSRDHALWLASQAAVLSSMRWIPAIARNQELIRATEDCISAISEDDVPSVVEHSDLSHPNLFLLPNDVLGVVDWELGDEQGLPLADMFFFIAFVAAAVDDAETPSEYERSFVSAFVGSKAWAADLLRRYREALQIDPGVARRLFLLCWFRQFANFATRAIQVSDTSVCMLSSASENRHLMYWQLAFDHFHELNL